MIIYIAAFFGRIKNDNNKVIKIEIPRNKNSYIRQFNKLKDRNKKFPFFKMGKYRLESNQD